MKIRIMYNQVDEVYYMKRKIKLFGWIRFYEFKYFKTVNECKTFIEKFNEFYSKGLSTKGRLIEEMVI